MSGTSDLRAEADRLKASTRLVAVMSQSMRMKRQGRLWMSCCPFHGVSRDNQGENPRQSG
jgi:hypothetical protein